MSLDHKDIGIVLFVIGLITFFVWAARAFVLARRREREAAPPEPTPAPPEPVEAEPEPDEAEPEPAPPEPAPPEPAPPEPDEPEPDEAEPEPDEAPTETAPAAKPVPKPVPKPKPMPTPAVEPVPEPAVAMPVPKPKPKVAPVLAKPKAKELKAGLKRTRRGFIAKLGGLFKGKREFDENLMDELEEVLFTADIGVRTSELLFEKVKQELNKKELKDPEAVWATIKEQAEAILSIDAQPLDLRAHKPFVLLTVGVNGVGKTTTIGKLAKQFSDEGLSCVLAAGDTFRAAAVEQLEVWAAKVNAPIVKGNQGQDPSSVIFDAIKKAQQDGMDVVIADTAGRLHTKVNLMEELQKIHRVCGKALDGAPHEILLVLDATTGQNAIQQANMFKEVVDVTGLVLTKLDGTAKGGIILGICGELNIPVRYIGIGEGVEDLRPFDAQEFVEALFAPTEEDA